MSTTFTAGELPETPPTSTTPAPNAGTQTERTDSGGTPSHDLEADLDDSHDEEVSRADSEHAQVDDSVTTPASPTADDDECVTCSTEVERCDTSTATD